MRLESEAVCIRIHMIKNEATVIHLQRKVRSSKKKQPFFMSVDVLSELQNFRPAKVYLPKVKLLYNGVVDSVNLRYNECDPCKYRQLDIAVRQCQRTDEEEVFWCQL
jgi:hypothetical protein